MRILLHGLVLREWVRFRFFFDCIYPLRRFGCKADVTSECELRDAVDCARTERFCVTYVFFFDCVFNALFYRDGGVLLCCDSLKETQDFSCSNAERGLLGWRVKLCFFRCAGLDFEVTNHVQFFNIVGLNLA